MVSLICCSQLRQTGASCSLVDSLPAGFSSNLPSERDTWRCDGHLGALELPPLATKSGGYRPTHSFFLGPVVTPATSPQESRGRAPPLTPSSATGETSCMPRTRSGHRRHGQGAAPAYPYG